jgi:hypothetical protein
LSIQVPFVEDEFPVVTPKKSPRGSLEEPPAVFVPVHVPWCVNNPPERSSSIGFKSEPDQSPVLVVLVVIRVPSAR